MLFIYELSFSGMFHYTWNDFHYTWDDTQANLSSSPWPTGPVHGSPESLISFAVSLLCFHLVLATQTFLLFPGPTYPLIPPQPI